MEVQVEYASENVEITYYVCQECGKTYIRISPGDTEEIRVEERKQQPAWTQSFMNFWGRRNK